MQANFSKPQYQIIFKIQYKSGKLHYTIFERFTQYNGDDGQTNIYIY